jgi:hypothetical protein
MFDERKETIKSLIGLGASMNVPRNTGDSNISSGYTYLGQFIAHEITFDRTQDLPDVEEVPPSYRSPQIDLDSLYGKEPRDEQSKLLYEDGHPARLEIGQTFGTSSLKSFENDLPRDRATGKALIGDERNDENLAVAQMNVAFITFHNKVVRDLEPQCPRETLFECAREQVVRHFQWIVLHDYLRTIVDEGILNDVIEKGPRWFKVERPDRLFMPLEFSVAAFRLGHSMVRPTYEWNYFQSTEVLGPAAVSQLFEQTAFSGMIGTKLENRENLRLPTDWIIDWRRFFDFSNVLQKGPSHTGSPYAAPKTGLNMARKIDTSINMSLEKIGKILPLDLPKDRKSIPVRNLLRGYALGLPTGEEVAEWMGETPLTQAEIASGQEQWLNSPCLKGRTPLWFYVLKEAELKCDGNRLGRVGSLIVAETLVGLIKNSQYSILDGSGWHPSLAYGRAGSGTEPVLFKMVDLLNYADLVNPLG